MKSFFVSLGLIVSLSMLARPGLAADVEPGLGYTNSFSSHPPATDWVTLSLAGSANANYEMDGDMNASVAVTGALRTTQDMGNPPDANSDATWSSTGQFIQTRPTGNRYTALIGKFVNKTGTNATEVSLSYLLSIQAGGVTEEGTKGTRVYYSFTGLINSWTNLPALNTTADSGVFNRQTNLTLNWPEGANLFFAWVDDNATGNPTDSPNSIDNFSLQVTAGIPLITDLTIILNGPTNNALVASGAPIPTAASILNGAAPFTVEYFTNSGLNNLTFASAGSSGSSPYNLPLGALSAGFYNIYAVVTDSAAVPVTARTVTNGFRVADPLLVILTAPADQTTVDNTTSVSATAAVAGGTEPYSVQFSLDGAAVGAPVSSAPFTHDFGSLFVGDHTIGARATDGNGWVSNSLLHNIHVTGPLGVSLQPTNAASFVFGQPVVLTAAPGGGNAPYSAAFYTNGQLAGEIASAPFTLNLGVLPVGNYASHVQVTDSGGPAQQAASTTNVFSVLPNPLTVTLTSPTNGQTSIPGAAFTLTANAAVQVPLLVTNVEFYYDGALAGADSSAPYTAAVASPAQGNHSLWAVATDTAGRRSSSPTNQISVQTPQGGNNNFVNAIPLAGPILTSLGSNVGANREFGEPQHGGNRGGASVWWSWTAIASGPTTIETLGSSFDTLLGVYTGNAVNQLSLVAGNDDFELNPWSRVQFTAVGGTVYRIAVDGFRSGFGGGAPPAETGNILLRIQGVGGLTISTPTNDTVVTFGEPIPVTAVVDSDFPSPPATRVDFYLGGVLFASSTTEPFTAVATNVPAGSNTLHVVAVNSVGTEIQSGPVRIFVQRVGVTILTPFEDNLFLSTNPITVTAWAYLPAGTITSVEFFVDGVKFAEDDSAPFAGVWTNLVGGSHRLTAVGRSDAGASYTSQTVNIGVAAPLIPMNSVWKYLDNGSDQGTNWTGLAFDDSGWTNGPAELGYGDGDEATVVGSGPEGGFYITTYFRHSFVVSNSASYINLAGILERDDAGVVYLNGVEVFRSSTLPPAPTPILFDTGTIGFGGEDTIETFNIGPTNLIEGVNVIAVEIHQQNATSSDISFNLSLHGIPAIIHNQFPLAVLTNPVEGASFVGPTSIPLEANASDADGTVTQVEFFSDGVLIGSSTNSPYTFTWVNPPIGAQSLTVVATDDLGGKTTSEPVPVVVYDAEGTPVARVIAPADGTILEGPTNLILRATANALAGVTNVEFFVNGVSVGQDASSPYQTEWSSSFGTNLLTAVVTDANGVLGTSPVSQLVVTIPPTNVVAPTLVIENPAAFATVTNLTRIAVTFSEIVQNVDASDLLLNGIPATGLTGSGSNYVFTFPQPPYGEVEVTWTPSHGITDYGYPAALPFDHLTGGWEYELRDVFPPTILARTPPAGVTLSNLTQVTVTFSEPVLGVDAGDLLVNGVPAYAFEGGISNFVFSISQPPSGPVNITWAPGHSITDQATIPNPFNALATGASWGLTFDSRITLVQSNATWRFRKGTAEASNPTTAWRQSGFDDSGWSNAAAPFYLLDPYNSVANPGTSLFDMAGNYSSIFLRRQFEVTTRSTIASVRLNAQSDDGFVVWINGNEVMRYNVGPGALAYNSTANSGAPEPSGAGAAYILHTLTNAQRWLVDGTNVIAIQAFNLSLVQTDFGFNAQLFVFTSDAGLVAPTISESIPAPSELFYLTNLVVTFSEAVTGVDATDLLVNGSAVLEVTKIDEQTYSFSFPQPSYGSVAVTWAEAPGIVDTDEVPKPFNGKLPSSILRYTLLNPSNPTIVSKTPGASALITNLTSISVTFSEAVTGVDAEDLQINGSPANAVGSSDGITYNFVTTRPSYGAVAVTWTTNHGIQDVEGGNPFDRTRFGGQWNYTLVNPVPTVALNSPFDGSILLAPANILVSAGATDNDGTIVRVEFLEGNALLNTFTGPPYSMVWSNVQAGAYTLRAVATDNSGYIVTSAPVSITVVTSLPIVLVRGPYLQVGTPSSGVVRWRTDMISDGVVFYGLDPENLTSIAREESITNEHIVQITGLEPATKYYYSIGSSGERLVGGSNYWFVTAPVPGTRKPSRFWVLGDSGTANNNQRAVRDAYTNYATTNGPADIWLMLGDNAYNSGTDSEHQAAVFEMYPTTLQNLFLWPTIGNHETGQSTTAEHFPYLDIFTLPTSGEAGGVPSGTERYYSFDYANVHFVCLDSMTSGRGASTPMAQWLIADLAATVQEWVIVFFHHPPYTKGSHNSDVESDLVQIRQNLLPILEAAGVDLVLGGHSHCYERSFLINGHYGLSTTFSSAMKVVEGNGREAGTGAYVKNEEGQGVVYSVAGSSGQISGGQLNHPAHFISLNQLGSVIIDVNGGRLDMSFLNSTGGITDNLTLLKRGPAGPAAPIDLIATVLDAHGISLTWGDNSTNETGFVVERSLDGTNFLGLPTLGANLTNLVDAGLLANTTYYYRVAATNELGTSAFSSVVSATTVAPIATPTPPSDLAASADNGQEFYRSRIILRWRDRSTNESGFLIERSSDGSTFTHIATVGANTTRYLDQGLESATYHYYRVRSFNGLGSSPASDLTAGQTHPHSDIVVKGQQASFHAGVEGLGVVSYQWRIEGVPIFGATNETFALNAVMPWDEGAYTVVIDDDTGRAESNPAYLFVISAPVVLSHPLSLTNNVGASASFSVLAVGDELLEYRWRFNGAFIPGASGPSLTIDHVQPGDEGNYDVVVDNDFGSVTSEVARLVVNLPPIAVADTVYRFAGEEVAVDSAHLLANDWDPSGGPVALVGVSTNSSQGGTVRMSGRFLIYSAPNGYNDADSFSYTIADGGGSVASALVSIAISSNTPPRIAEIPDLIASVLTPVVLQNVVIDTNVPSDRLQHSVIGASPPNARISSDSGLFVWTPTREQAPSTNSVTLMVTDDGTPALSAIRSFVVVVKDYVELTAGSAVVRAGEVASVPLRIYSSAGLKTVQIELHYPAGALGGVTVESLIPDLADLVTQTTGPTSIVLNFAARPGQVLQGAYTLAQLQLPTVAGQRSGFSILGISALTFERAEEGLLPSTLLHDGRLTIVGDQALLETRFGPALERELVLYGKVGVRYTIESSANPADPTGWTAWQQVSMTNLFHVEILPEPGPPSIFYRARD